MPGLQPLEHFSFIKALYGAVQPRGGYWPALSDPSQCSRDAIDKKSETNVEQLMIFQLIRYFKEPLIAAYTADRDQHSSQCIVQ